MRPFGSAARAAVVIALFAAGGCTTTCEQSCKKLLDCDEVGTARVSLDECTTSCELQEALVASWEDTQLETDFDAMKTCIRRESCEAVAEGACYDEAPELWAF